MTVCLLAGLRKYYWLALPKNTEDEANWSN